MTKIDYTQSCDLSHLIATSHVTLGMAQSTTAALIKDGSVLHQQEEEDEGERIEDHERCSAEAIAVPNAENRLPTMSS